jgi:hypothetical protein
MFRFASAITVLWALCPAATALAAGGGAKTGAPVDPAVIAQAPAESAGQGRESFQAIEGRFLVQQAVDAGLDAERAGRMRDILAAHRKARRETLDLIGQGKIPRAEMRSRARKIREDRDERLKALLGEKIYAVLDWGKAAFRATEVVMDRPSMHAFLTGEKILDYCNRRDDERSRLFCQGYIAAVVDSRLASGPGGRRGARRFCVPDRIFRSRGDPLEVFLWAVMQHLTKTPAARAKVGFEAAAEVLAAEFPC